MVSIHIAHHNTEPFENTSLYYYNECTRSAEPLPSFIG